MSKAFREKFGKKKYSREDVRAFTAITFPVDDNGKVITMTEQGHLAECDVNNIIKKYDATGLINHINHFEAIYGDVSSLEFREALDLQMKVGNQFMNLPSDIRTKFDNEPAKLLAFLENPANRDEAVALGLRKGPQMRPVAPRSAQNSDQGSPSPDQ